jgi:hypothetical protein
MRKNPQKRIGRGTADAEEIKAQDWFKVYNIVVYSSNPPNLAFS